MVRCCSLHFVHDPSPRSRLTFHYFDSPVLSPSEASIWFDCASYTSDTDGTAPFRKALYSSVLTHHNHRFFKHVHTFLAPSLPLPPLPLDSFLSFPVPQSEYSDVAMHHLPQQLAPSWCTKPQDNWAAMAGFDMGVDPDDAGPFRWFIDERSLSAPGTTALSVPLNIDTPGSGVGCSDPRMTTKKMASSVQVQYKYTSWMYAGCWALKRYLVAQ